MNEIHNENRLSVSVAVDDDVDSNQLDSNSVETSAVNSIAAVNSFDDVDSNAVETFDDAEN